MEFALLFDVEEERDDRNGDAGDKANDWDNKGGPNGGERECWSGDAAVGDVELGVRFSGSFDELPVDAVMVEGIGEVG